MSVFLKLFLPSLLSSSYPLSLVFPATAIGQS
nr:MAG TPA: hypothetical protein [Caudoviricetes sp.]